MVGSDLPLISYRSILEEETLLERLSLQPLPPPQLYLLHFYFGVAARQWKLCTAWENHFEARMKTGREEKWVAKKVNRKRVRAEGRKMQAK